MFCLELIQGLVQCNGTVTKLQLCSLEADYNAGSTGTGTIAWGGYPLPVKTAINVLKIAQFDENQNTITLNIPVIWKPTSAQLRVGSVDEACYSQSYTLVHCNSSVF